MKLGTWMSIVSILAGVWVILSPYMVGFAPKHGNPWTGIVLGTTILGALMILASLVGLIGFWGLRLKEMGQEVHRPAEQQ
ncbi:MAG: hypothetical protein M1272_07230 [Firmicutes bacterium]|nr:hypothetical protein [Bacillota bacterium]